MTEPRTFRFDVVETVHEVQIDAPAQRVWEALTERLSAWWPRDFLVGDQAGGLHMDTRLGGLVYEDWGDGQGVVWGTISLFERGRRLAFQGDLDLAYGGPAKVKTTYVLSEDGEGTRVRLTEVTAGAVSASVAKCTAEGWAHLLDECLKPFVERSAADLPA